jgi:hypothetical protein
MISDLSRHLQQLNVAADWIGLRANREVIRTRSVRDGIPTDNGTQLNQGVMVEVLVKGRLCCHQFLPPRRFANRRPSGPTTRDRRE